MILDKLANVLTRHYRKVLIAWILILLISVPAIVQTGDVLKSQSTGVTTGNYDSVKAGEIISSEFQTSVANGTIIIVLQSNDMTDATARDYVLALQQKILSSTKLTDFTGMATVYSLTNMVIDQTVMALCDLALPCVRR